MEDSMTIQSLVDARDNPGPAARFCPHCGGQMGACIRWDWAFYTQCIHCRWQFHVSEVLTWHGGTKDA